MSEQKLKRLGQGIGSKGCDTGDTLPEIPQELRVNGKN